MQSLSIKHINCATPGEFPSSWITLLNHKNSQKESVVLVRAQLSERSRPLVCIYVSKIQGCKAASLLWGWHRVTSLLCHVTHAFALSKMHGNKKKRWKQKQMASSGLCSPFSPSAMISSTVTWCRPTVKALPMKFPPAWLDPELPPPPEPGPELTNSRRESKNFLMLTRRQEEDYIFLCVCQTSCLPFLQAELLHK